MRPFVSREWQYAQTWRALSRRSCRESDARGMSERRERAPRANGATESAGEACGEFAWIGGGFFIRPCRVAAAMLTPLQISTPGGAELLVIFLIVVVNLLIVAALIGGVLYLIRRADRGGDERDRVEELEARVEELESELRDR